MTEVDKQHNFEDESKRDELIENVNEELNQDFNWIEIFSGFQAFLQLPLEFLVDCYWNAIGLLLESE